MIIQCHYGYRPSRHRELSFPTPPMKTTIATTILLASTASAFPTFDEFAKKFEKKYTRAERALRAAIYAKNILAYQEHNEKNIVGVFPQVQLSLF